MSTFQLAKRYAQAFSSGLSEAEKKSTLADFESVQTLVKTSPVFRSFLTNQVLLKKKKEELLSVFFEKTMHRETFAFLNFLLAQGRLAQVGEIAKAYLALEEERLNRVKVVFSSKVALGEAFKKKLVSLLEKNLGKKVFLLEKLDSKLLGGFKVQIGDKLYDHTLSEKLSRLKQHLLRA